MELAEYQALLGKLVIQNEELLIANQKLAARIQELESEQKKYGEKNEPSN